MPRPAWRPAGEEWASIFVGALLGVALAAANVYTGLKVAYIDGGAISAALVSYLILRMWRRDWGRSDPVNLAQITASTAASMVAVLGLAGPWPALRMTGVVVHDGVLIVWGCSLGAWSIWLGWSLRYVLLERAKLRFPTGEATAGVIRAIQSDGAARRRHGLTLALVGLGAAMWTLARDGAGVVPATWAWPGQVAGVAAAALGVGVSLSPLVAATGGLVGVSASASAVLGGSIAWFVVVPNLVAQGWIAPTFEAAAPWLVWPALGCLLGGTSTSFLADRGLTVRAWQDLRAAWRTGPKRRVWHLIGLGLASLVAVVSHAGLGLSWGATMVALAASVVFALICGRAAGETDVAPVGAAGTVGQVVTASHGPVASLTSGAVVAGAAAGAAQTLWSLRASTILGTRRAAVFLAQGVGVIVGACVAVPVFNLVERAYGIGTASMPAWGAQSWKATADALTAGVEQPVWAWATFVVGFSIGVIGAWPRVPQWLRWRPNPIGLGIGVMVPFSFSATMLLGALALGGLKRWNPRVDVAVWVGGAIAGESLTAVLLSLLV